MVLLYRKEKEKDASSLKLQCWLTSQGQVTAVQLTHIIGFEHDLDVTLHFTAVLQLDDDAVAVCVLDDLSNTEVGMGRDWNMNAKKGQND